MFSFVDLLLTSCSEGQKPIALMTKGTSVRGIFTDNSLLSIALTPWLQCIHKRTANYCILYHHHVIPVSFVYWYQPRNSKTCIYQVLAIEKIQFRIKPFRLNNIQRYCWSHLRTDSPLNCFIHELKYKKKLLPFSLFCMCFKIYTSKLRLFAIKLRNACTSVTAYRFDISTHVR